MPQAKQVRPTATVRLGRKSMQVITFKMEGDHMPKAASCGGKLFLCPGDNLDELLPQEQCGPLNLFCKGVLGCSVSVDYLVLTFGRKATNGQIQPKTGEHGLRIRDAQHDVESAARTAKLAVTWA